VNTLTLSNEDIVRDLQEDIVFGVFHPKERLTEEDLMARFGLKRHAVRDVLSQLDSAGFVVRVPNRGAYVRELTPEEVIEIYEVREILEVAAALRTPLPAPKEIIEGLKNLQNQHSEAIASVTIHEGLLSLAMAHAAQESARKHELVSVNAC
jgi:DNA-binding GntR family transcriptional regulator